jgi:hypothetical protein
VSGIVSTAGSRSPPPRSSSSFCQSFGWIIVLAGESARTVTALLRRFLTFIFGGEKRFLTPFPPVTPFPPLLLDARPKFFTQRGLLFRSE